MSFGVRVMYNACQKAKSSQQDADGKLDKGHGKLQRENLIFLSQDGALIQLPSLNSSRSILSLALHQGCGMRVTAYTHVEYSSINDLVADPALRDVTNVRPHTQGTSEKRCGLSVS